MSNPVTLQSSPGLSDILGAYDTGHWETVVAQLKPASGVLLRGSVLSAVVADGGKLSLTAGGAEATAYGILLDKAVDTAAAYSGGSVTASVARAGSFRGPAQGRTKRRSPNNCAQLESSRKGPIAPVTLAAAEAPEHERRQREEDRRHK